MKRNFILILTALCNVAHAQSTPDPPLVTDPAKIINSTTYDLGERLLTVQEVTKEAMPMPPAPPQVAAPTPIEPKSLPLEHHAFVSLGASIYKRAGQPTRSLITYYIQGQQTPVTFWSSADWSLIAGIAELTAPDGRIWSLFCMHTVIDLDVESPSDFPNQYPTIPEMPAGPSTYRLETGNPTADQMAPISLFHAHYDAHLAELKAAAQARIAEQNRLAAEALANPPGKKDITVQFRVLSPDEIVTPAPAANPAP